MFIPVALGLLDSTGKDMPLFSVYQDGTLKSFASDDQPVYSTVLRVTKVSWNFCLPLFACACWFVLGLRLSMTASISVHESLSLSLSFFFLSPRFD